jgi:hypothetical protein
MFASEHTLAGRIMEHANVPATSSPHSSKDSPGKRIRNHIPFSFDVFYDHIQDS